MADEHVVCECPSCSKAIVLHGDRGQTSGKAHPAGATPLGLIADLNEVFECPHCNMTLLVECDMDFDMLYEVRLVVCPDEPETD